MNSINRNGLQLILLSVGMLLFASAVAADILIDDFTTPQNVSNTSSGPVNINSGTQLTGLTRTLLATPSNSPVGAKTTIDIREGYLDVANDYGSSGAVSIQYSFSGLNLAANAQSFLFDIDFVDSNPKIQLIANGSSVFDYTAVGGAGLFEIEFIQFSNPAVFLNLTSLQLNLVGPRNWDASFKSLSAESNNVPEPSTLCLLVFGTFVVARKRFLNVAVKYA